MRPDYHEAIIDTIRYYGWEKIIYLYDSHDGEFDIFMILLLCNFPFDLFSINPMKVMAHTD